MPSAANKQAPLRLLQPEVLSRLGNLELLARTVVDGVLTGLHRSPHFGFSQEFAEYRAYNEGDDLRFVDWNVYARTDRTYIKRFRGDTNTALTILLDASASMGFGGADSAVVKFDYARYLVASLVYLANKQHDAVGCTVFDSAVRKVIPPSSRPDAMARLFATLQTEQAASATNVESAMESLLAQSSRRGIVALVSDFYTQPDAFLKALQPLAHSRQDIVLFQIVDPAELAPEYASVVSLRDMETDEKLDVDPDWLKTEYRQRFSDHCDAIQQACRGVGADYIRLTTDQPLDDALQQYLLFRQRKL